MARSTMILLAVLMPCVASQTSATSAASAPVCWSGMLTVQEYLDCLRSIPLDEKRRDCTLEILRTQMQSLYAYSGLINNSTDNDAQLAPGFDFPVYEIALRDYLRETWATLQHETSAGLFALQLTELFHKFEDAHTQIVIAPIVLAHVSPPLAVDARWNAASDELDFVVSSMASWVEQSFVGKKISTINGKAPLAYYLEAAKVEAKVKNRGVQLNRFLQYQRLGGMRPPSDGEFDVVFTDGVSARLQWMVSWPDYACKLRGIDICLKDDAACQVNMPKTMQTCFEGGIQFKDFVQQMKLLGMGDMHCSPGGTPMAAVTGAECGGGGVACDRSLTTASARPDHADVTPEGPSQVSTHEIGSSSRQQQQQQQHQQHAAQTDVEPDAGLAFQAKDCEVVNSTLSAGRLATVLKINKFGSWYHLKQCAEFAVDLAAHQSDGNLIIDVISNGGGTIQTGYLLNYYLYHNMRGTTFREPSDACEWYDFPKNSMLDWLVDLSKQPLSGLQVDGDVTSAVKQMIQTLESGRQMFGSLSDGEFHFHDDDISFDFGYDSKSAAYADALQCLNSLLSDIPNVADAASLFKLCMDQANVFGGGIDIMGYFESNTYPNATSPPSWDYYTRWVSKLRGGELRAFSSMAFFSPFCPAYYEKYANVFPDSWLVPRFTPQTKLKHITYLSDGSCGSTCSVSSSRPYLDGLATFVTFGGVKGETMSITSFNGGNINTYEMIGTSSKAQGTFWRKAILPLVEAKTFFPNATPPSFPFSPLPLNVYDVTFTQRAEYIRALGPRALPREWYVIPASYHLDIWTTEHLNVWANATSIGKQKLVELYAAVAALPPKPFSRKTPAAQTEIVV